MENKRPVIILKKAAGHGGHHGGAWKVAYADFVTAMMALFIVLWLLTQADMRLRQQVAQYFRSPGVLSGGSMITSDVNEAKSREPKVVSKDIIIVQGKGEQERLEGEANEIKAAVARAAQENPEIAKLKDQVIVQVTDAGLVIEVVDKGRNLLFDLSSADLKPALVGLLRNIAGRRRRPRARSRQRTWGPCRCLPIRCRRPAETRFHRRAPAVGSPGCGRATS